MFPGLPTVELVLPPPIEGESGLTAISLVDRPAIGVDFVLFQENGKPVPKPLKLHFDAERGIVTGPILIPNQPVYRAPTEEYPKGYACYLTQETIHKAVQMFFAQGKTVALNIMHDPLQRCSGFIFETWMKEDPARDKSEIHFPGLPVGTAFISVQLTDQPTIERVKSGELAGFSMEGYFREIERQILLSQGQEKPTSTKQEMAQQPPKKTNQAAAKKPAAAAPSKNVLTQFLAGMRKVFSDMGMADMIGPDADDILSAETVQVVAEDGTTVSLALDANGEVACIRADGTPAMLQLSEPEGEDAAAEPDAATAAEPGPGASTEAVDNPMDVAALRAQFRGQKFSAEQMILLQMAGQMAELQKQLQAMQEGTPATKPAKGPDNRARSQSFGRQGAPPKKEDFGALVEERMTNLREERNKPKGAAKD